MKCYTCTKEGRDADAVAVCAVCGMSLCMEHVHEVEAPMVQRVSGWASRTSMHIISCAKDVRRRW